MKRRNTGDTQGLGGFFFLYSYILTYYRFKFSLLIVTEVKITILTLDTKAIVSTLSTLVLMMHDIFLFSSNKPRANILGTRYFVYKNL